MKKNLLIFTLLFITAFSYTAQAQVSKTVACTAGNLATLTAGYAATVTNLTVTGTIDARDFITMRDLMPVLEVIDLSGVFIWAYTGMGANNEIPIKAFYNSTTKQSKISLKSFIFPPSINSIGYEAFRGCSGLTGSLTIPQWVTKIGGAAFQSCSGLTGALTIGSSVKIIDGAAFQGCSGMTGSLTIPSSVTTIGSYAFQGCSGFTGSLTIPPGLTLIYNNVFQGCSGFTGSLIIPSSVTIISDSAFVNCSGFTGSLTIGSSVTSISNDVFQGCSGFTGSLIIPTSVTTIGSKAFEGCSGFDGSINISSSITSIEDGVFAYCSGLTGSITIPASLTALYSTSFLGCGGQFDVDTANPKFSSLDGILFSKDKTALINCPISKTGSYVIPSTVTSIDNNAFYGCKSLTNIIVSASVVNMEFAFPGCSGQIDVDAANPNYSSLDGVLFNKVKTVLKHCPSSKTNYVIPESVTEIFHAAFYDCRSLTSLTIPSSVTKIWSNSFYNCSGLTSINALSTTPLNKTYQIFSEVDKTKCVLHVPVGSKALYKAAYAWKDFVNIVDDLVPTSIEEVLSSAVTVYPNPASSAITVSELGSLVGDKTITLSVIDVSGTTVLTNSVEPNTNSLTINVSTLKNGVYFIVIQTNNGQVVKRFIKG